MASYFVLHNRERRENKTHNYPVTETEQNNLVNRQTLENLNRTSFQNSTT